MGRKKKGHLKYFLLVALLLHWWIFTQPIPQGFLRSSESARRGPVEVERFKDSKLPLVQTNRALVQSAKRDKARYAGEFDQRVDKETRSPHKGRFNDGVANPAISSQRLGRNVRPEDLGEEGTLAENGGPALKELMDLSSSPNVLSEEIQLGDKTILNTDSVSYASFLNRVADEIYQPWVDHAREAAHNIYLVGGTLQARTYITKLAISMDDSGRVIAIQTLKSSGVSALDEAPKQAFWDRDPFPNPPEQMRAADGSVRFAYEFHFEWKSSSFNIVPWAI